LRLIEDPADRELPETVIAPAEIGLRRMLAPAPLALSEAPDPNARLRELLDAVL